MGFALCIGRKHLKYGEKSIGHIQSKVLIVVVVVVLLAGCAHKDNGKLTKATARHR